MPKQLFTPENAVQMQKIGVGSKKAIAKMQKQMVKMGIEGEALKETISILKALILTPVGSIIVSWFIIDLAQKTGYIQPLEGDALKAVVTSAELIGALGGGQGIAGVVGALAAVA